MKKILPRFLLFISLFSLVSCTITKRKYTGGFNISWNKKAPDAVRPHLRPNGSLERATLSYEEREKSRPHCTCEVVLRGQEKSMLCLPVKNISTTYKDINSRNAASQVQSDYNPTPMHVQSITARNRDNGLTGFEMGLLNIICTALLLFFGHIGYAVFVIGLFLIFLFLFIAGLIYSFMGLNKQDKHRGLGLIGVLLEAAAITALIMWG